MKMNTINGISKHFEIIKYKILETELIFFGFHRGFTWFNVDFHTSWCTDHSGFRFSIALMSLYFNLNFYDTRHWDYRLEQRSKNVMEDIDVVTALEQCGLQLSDDTKMRYKLAQQDEREWKISDQDQTFLNCAYDYIDEHRKNERNGKASQDKSPH